MEPQTRIFSFLIICGLGFLLLSAKLTIGLLVAFISYHVLRIYRHMGGNPFSIDSRQPRRNYVLDQKKRDAVIKQSFAANKVPRDLDAIVIGSGIGGLTTAVLLAKVGKKVLVLEQHDQAGGCCHTFIDKGYEFDVGIHYIGEIGPGELNRTFVDHITDGQLQWQPLDQTYDQITIGFDEQKKAFPVSAGKNKWKNYLLETFPNERAGIEKFFQMVEATKSFDTINGLLKILPLWASWLLIHLRIIHFFCPLWSGIYRCSTGEIIQQLTNDKDLQTILTYCWGDYGSPPFESHFIMHASLVNHFAHTGGYYPIGGASEIAFNMIPIIERQGGKVLVKANVSAINCENGKAIGVEVTKGSEKYQISAPIIISNAGAFNTFHRLLPPQISNQSYFSKLLKNRKPGLAAMSIFIGLKASNEQLNLKAHNIWAFTSNNAMNEFSPYIKSDANDVCDRKVPLLFISFPSAKDPQWTKNIERQDKSTCAIVTISNWEWFKEWQDKPLKRRGDDYDGLKKTIGEIMIDQACQLFPQIKDHIDYVEIGSPVTNYHYLAAPHGEIYGMDHSHQRFDPWTLAQMRPCTDVSGLYLTGQDAMLCGFTGALFGGLLCAGSILGRNIMDDLENLHGKLHSQNK